MLSTEEGDRVREAPDGLRKSRELLVGRPDALLEAGAALKLFNSACSAFTTCNSALISSRTPFHC